MKPSGSNWLAEGTPFKFVVAFSLAGGIRGVGTVQLQLGIHHRFCFVCSGIVDAPHVGLDLGAGGELHRQSRDTAGRGTAAGHISFLLNDRLPAAWAVEPTTVLA